MSDTLVSARTPLHPTVVQHAALTALWTSANSLHLTVRRWLRLTGLGRTLHVREALWQVADGHALPHVPDSRPIDIRLDAAAQLGALRAEQVPPAWGASLCAETIQAILSIELRRLQQYGRQEQAGRALPLRPLVRVPLDAGVQPTTLCQISLDGGPGIVADLWALPNDLTDALLGLPCPEGLRDRTRPHRVQHASLVRQAAPGGGLQWAIDWTIRIPRGYLPRAHVSDVLGIDLGYRRLVTAADGQTNWMVERQGDVHYDLPDPPDAENHRSIAAHARLRRRCLELHRHALEDTVRRALRYQEVHIEQVDYPGLSDHGGAPWSAQAMLLLGVQYVPAWIELLAPATGTRVRHTDPGQGSRVCARCGASGTRPRPYDRILCPNCGSLDADVNSAQLARLQGVAAPVRIGSAP